MASRLKAALFTLHRITLWQCQQHVLRHSSNTSASRWHLYSAVCLERVPVITATPNELERRFAKLTEQLDFEKSLRSDFELRYEEDIVKLAQWKKGELDDKDEESTSTMLSAQDVEDAATEEFNQFRFASRLTDADKKNDRRSLNRALEEYLVLVVKQQLGQTTPWVLPQGQWQTGETMRQTAERVLKSTCGELKVTWLGHAPIGFYKYKYPLSMRNDKENPVQGAKVFFFRASYHSGQVTNSDDIKDYQWVTSKEIQELVMPVYFKCVSPFLVELQSPQPCQTLEECDEKARQTLEECDEKAHQTLEECDGKAHQTLEQSDKNTQTAAL